MVFTLSASLTATRVLTLTPSVPLMALGLHIPPVRATCERLRMVVMVARDLLERRETGLQRQSLPQTQCQTGGCQRLWAIQRGEKLCLHLRETSTLDPLRQNRLNVKAKDFPQLQLQPQAKTGPHLLLSRGSQLSPHSGNLEGGRPLQVTDSLSRQAPENLSSRDNLKPK